MSATLQPLTYTPLPLGAVKPLGWLARQLDIQLHSLSGNLHRVWPDVRDSGWVGGSAEGWERMPYWLDGALPLAVLTGDTTLTAEVTGYIETILDRQHDDGWLGPVQTGDYQAMDPWPVFVMCKVLTQYAEATGSQRAIDAMLRFCRRLAELLPEKPLFDWSKSRWQDMAWVLQWLHGRTGENWLIDLANLLHVQGYDWIAHLADLPYKDAVQQWEYESHVVNHAMAVKAAGVLWRLTGRADHRAAVWGAINELDRYHGQATGVFTGDECLAGLSPSRGTELCAVVEYLFSLEVLLAATGDPALADRWERIAFNALPATFSPDMWTHQYDQQANQVACTVNDPPIFGTNGPDANCFGLAPHFGCCTANLSQGWPKFAAHAWLAGPDGGLLATSYVPAEATHTVDGVAVGVRVDSDYPFSPAVTIRVEPDAAVRMPLHLRIPAWAEGATLTIDGQTVDCQAGAIHTVDRTWEAATELTLDLPMHLSSRRRFHHAMVIDYGPMVMSLTIGERWEKFRGEHPAADYEVRPTAPWNYALALEGADLAEAIRVEHRPVGDCPFSPAGAPIVATAPARRLPGWGLDRGSAAPPPLSPAETDQPLETVTLIPYGCTNLRLTELPTTQTD